MRHWVIAVAVAMSAAACGDSGPSTATLTNSGPGSAPPSSAAPAPPPSTLEPADAAAWVTATPPAGFAPVHADESDDGTRTILYSSRGCDRDVYDSALTIASGPSEELALVAQYGEGELTLADGRTVAMSTLRSDGDDFGFGAAVEPVPGTWVSVTVAEPLGVDDLRTVLDGLSAVDDEEWARLARALSIDSRVGRADEAPVEVEVVVGMAEGERFVLTALVPGDYPLGDDDCRRACVRLDHAGATSGEMCESHPVRRRIGGHVFVFGLVEPGPVEVAVSPIEGGVGETISVPVAQDAAWPNGFYAAHLPSEWCFLRVDAAIDSYYLGETGPLTGYPDRDACIAALDSVATTGPPQGPG